MAAQHARWPEVGSEVWIVRHHHTWDAILNNTYSPVLRKVLSVGTDTVHLEDEADRRFTECYPSREQCESACPEPHADE